MIRKLLIASRGEAAHRIIATCRSLGLATVGISDEGDAPAGRVVRAASDDVADCEADELVGIKRQTGLDDAAWIEQVIEAAHRTGADAIHPGYGVMAENPNLSREVRRAGLGYIGPSTDTIEVLRDRVSARAAARRAGLPTVPGTEALTTRDEAVAAAQELGWPVLIKPLAGGGGFGLAAADDAEALRRVFDDASHAALRWCNDLRVYLEKHLPHARHIEIQIAADRYGNVIDLGERECSVQDRHHKIIDESPSPQSDTKLRQELSERSRHLAAFLGYRGLGTAEWLVCPSGNYYFLEMHTRLQVEHAVTEVVTGLDLVEWQMRLALGEPLPPQSDVASLGHAIECRIYIDDQFGDAPPVFGRLTRIELPAGPWIRVDVGYREGDAVSSANERLLAKLIVVGATRMVAVQRLRSALLDTRFVGVKTNMAMLRRIADAHAFAMARFDTDSLPVD